MDLFAKMFSRRAVRLAAVAMLVFVGCADFNNPLDSPSPGVEIQPENRLETPGTLSKKGTERVDRADADNKATNSIIATRQMVSARNGGVLRLRNAIGDKRRYHYVLHVPPGALTEDVVITMQLASEDVATLDFFPEGLRFKTPARLIVQVLPELRNTDIHGKEDVYWYNPATTGWETQGGQVGVLKNGMIQGVVDLHHFSRYSLGGDNPIQKWEYQSYYYDPYFYYSY